MRDQKRGYTTISGEGGAGFIHFYAWTNVL